MENNLKSVMVLKGDNQKSLAAKLHLTQATLCSKMKGKTEWKLDEMKQIRSMYDLNGEQLMSIFFD